MLSTNMMVRSFFNEILVSLPLIMNAILIAVSISIYVVLALGPFVSVDDKKIASKHED